MMMANDSILNKSDHHHLHQQQQHSKFPNVQSYTEQDIYNYSNYSLTSIKAKQQQQNYSYDLNYSKNRSQNSGTNQTEIDEKEEPDYFQDMVPEFKKPKTIYVNKHDHPMADIHNNDENELNKIERKFRFMQQNQHQQNDPYQMNNNHSSSMLDETKFTNQFGSLDDIDISVNPSQMDMKITSWEEMANEDEELWIDTDQQLETMRRQRREQRLNEHRRQRQLKQLAKK
nr:transcription factor SPT20 homolog [Dermatophagoides farinae]